MYVMFSPLFGSHLPPSAIVCVGGFVVFVSLKPQISNLDNTTCFLHCSFDIDVYCTPGFVDLPQYRMVSWFCAYLVSRT